MGQSEACVCQTACEVESDRALEVLADIRAGCPVLSAIILPESVWPAFQEWHRNPDQIACHRSVSLLALERGFLSRVTSPIHRYLMDGGSIRQEVTKQYISDLRERWMQYQDAIERHHKSKMFRGRVVELQFAEWLALKGTCVTGLEALGASSDVESNPGDGTTTAFEVKFIGSEDQDFAMLLKSIAGQPAGGSVSPYAAAGAIGTGITFIGTYSVNADCTGTAELTDSFGRTGTRAFVIVEEGKEIQYLFTDPGFVATGVAKKQ